MNEYSISKQTMRRGKLGNIHILIKMRTLHKKKKKKKESIDILTAAHKLIHEMMGMRGTTGSKVLTGDKVIHLMRILLKEAACILQFILVVLDRKEKS